MADTRADIPDRDLFKASEVCEIASVQPYVLRSWEQEFPSMGTSRSSGAPRVYRRVDVERVLRIKELVFGEGLTLAGARRQIEDEEGGRDAAPETIVVGAEARQKLDSIRQGLRALRDMLGSDGAQRERGGWPPSVQSSLVGFDGDPNGAPAAGTGTRKAASGRKRSPRPSKEG